MAPSPAAADQKVSVLASAQSETDRMLAALEKEMRTDREETHLRFDIFDADLASLGARLTLEVGLLNRKIDGIERDNAKIKEHVFLLTGMVTALDAKVDGLDKKVDRLGKKFDGLERKVDGLERKVDGLDSRVQALETRMDKLETRMDGLETRMDGLETRMDGLETRMDRLETKVDGLDARLTRVEEGITELLARIPARD